MSITFSCPEAPSETKRVPCTSPDLGLTCTAEERCGYCDNGWEIQYVSEAPEINLANVSALNTLSLLGCPRVTEGSFSAADVPGVLRSTLRALNIEGHRAHLIYEPAVIPGEMRLIEDDNMLRMEHGCREIICGNTDEQTLSRLERLRDLLVYAADHGCAVTWS